MITDKGGNIQTHNAWSQGHKHSQTHNVWSQTGAWTFTGTQCMITDRGTNIYRYTMYDHGQAREHSDIQYMITDRGINIQTMYDYRQAHEYSHTQSWSKTGAHSDTQYMITDKGMNIHTVTARHTNIHRHTTHRNIPQRTLYSDGSQTHFLALVLLGKSTTNPPVKPALIDCCVISSTWADISLTSLSEYIWCNILTKFLF